MKNWFQSKTIWFNLITMLVLVAQSLVDFYPEYIQYTGLVVMVGNIILRVWFTSTQINLEKIR